MPPELSILLPILSIAIALFAAVGVVIAFLGNRNRGLSEIQSSTITALQAQNDAQEVQILALEKKMARCDGVIDTIQAILKPHGMHIDINADSITLVEEGARRKSSVQIKRPAKQTKEEKEDS